MCDVQEKSLQGHKIKVSQSNVVWSVLCLVYTLLKSYHKHLIQFNVIEDKKINIM